MASEIIKNVEIARVGTFGEDGTTITENILQDAVNTFEGRAPITLGHRMATIFNYLPEDARPKFGSVLGPMKYNPATKTLTADIILTDMLQQAFDDGFYDALVSIV